MSVSGCNDLALANVQTRHSQDVLAHSIAFSQGCCSLQKNNLYCDHSGTVHAVPSSIVQPEDVCTATHNLRKHIQQHHY